jgi:hypothetical protein
MHSSQSSCISYRGSSRVTETLSSDYRPVLTNASINSWTQGYNGRATVGSSDNHKPIVIAPGRVRGIEVGGASSWHTRPSTSSATIGMLRAGRATSPVPKARAALINALASARRLKGSRHLRVGPLRVQLAPPGLDEFSTQGRPSKRVGTGHEAQLLQIVPGELMRRCVCNPLSSARRGRSLGSQQQACRHVRDTVQIGECPTLWAWLHSC